MGDLDGDGVEDEPSPPCDAPGTVVTESTEAIAVPPVEEVHVHLPYDAPDSWQEWPRRVRALEVPDGPDADTSRDTQLLLCYPAASRAHRSVIFTEDMYVSWLTARGETRDSSAVATWGPKTTLDLVVSKIDADDHLVFDPNATDARISLDVYNLDTSQPKWRRLIEMSFAIVPITHLQRARLKSVFLDFYVGTNQIGRNAAVHDGGTNWLLSADGTTATRGISPDGCSCVCATYAALNRAWGQRDRRALPATEEEIDDAFDHERRGGRTLTTPYIQSTFFHELGHLLDNSGIAGAAGVARPNTVWNDYRLAMEYHGESNGPGEGFAEAYRQRLLGRTFSFVSRDDEDDEYPADEPCRR
jgi:hypothetical protein